MKYYRILIGPLCLVFMITNTFAKDGHKFKCKKPITELSLVYFGDEAADIIIYDKKKKGAAIKRFNAIEKGDILEVNGLADVKYESLWELYEAGSELKLGESLFVLDCKDKDMNEPQDCGNQLGDGKKKDKHDRYLNNWLFNGLTDKKGNSFRCDLPETRVIPPKITLFGDQHIMLEIGDDYIELGAGADDNLDGNLTDLITIETDLDTLVVGTYTVTYTVTDFDGNTSTATRSVTVSDENIKIRTLQSRVIASSDDAEQDAQGKVYLKSSDLELSNDVGNNQTNHVGIRFLNLNIPQDSVINKAYIQFKVDEVSLENADLTIYAEKNNYAATFNDSPSNLTSREKTDNAISWATAPWSTVGAATEVQRTPDLTPLIQEVVSATEWVNSLVFIFEGQGTRTAESYDGDPEGAPLLYLEYLGGTPIQTVTVPANIKRLLPVSSLDYKLVNAPNKGTLEINSETSEFIYIANANETGRDVLKFESSGAQTNADALIIKINISPTPVMLNGSELLNFSSNLPLLIIDTSNRAIPDEPKIKGILTIIPPNSSGRSSLLSAPDYSDHMEIELRGSSSLKFPKKGFGLDTETFDGEDNDVSLLGMPEEHKWVLHGPYSDKSLMRNYIAYNKTRDMGGYAAVRNKYVEVLIQEGDSYSYHGVYVFMEKLKRDKNRINIDKLKSSDTQLPDISGGYIMAQDRAKDDWFFKTSLKQSQVVLEYPKSDNLNDEQKNYIQGFMNSFESALFADDFNDPESGNYYENFIEPDSFAKHLLSRELFRDVDIWGKSEYFHKQREGKLSMLPVWDFNLGLGNANFGYNGAVGGWIYQYKNSGTGGWMNRLMNDSKFRDSVREKWLALRSGLWSDSNLNAYIDETKDLLRESQSRNFQRWPVLGTYVWPNRLACDGGTSYCDTWDKAVDEHLRAWLLARAAWMDANFPE